MGHLHMIALETIPRVDEIRALRRAIASCNISLPFWISCVFPGDEDVLPDGSTVDQVMEAMLGRAVEGPAPWGVGINCTKMDKLPRLVRALELSMKKMLSKDQVYSRPSLVLYPDGMNGKVYNTTTKSWELSDALVALQSKTPWASQLASLAKEIILGGNSTLFWWAVAAKRLLRILQPSDGSLIPEVFSMNERTFNTSLGERWRSNFCKWYEDTSNLSGVLHAAIHTELIT
ncbi:homocysteine S-methyltransferase, partial [Colletotrichum tofieldiae]